MLLRVLEIALFVVVVVGGAVLTSVGLQGPEEGDVARAGAGINLFPGTSGATTTPPSPAPDFTTPPTEPPLTLPPGAQTDRVLFINSRSNGVAEGCTGHLRFFWEAEPSTAPPDGSPGIIRLTGPAKAGRYTRPFTGGRLEFEIDVPLGSGLASWEAIVLSVGGRPTDSVKLGWSFHPCRG
jgi:hypothetical protein